MGKLLGIRVDAALLSKLEKERQRLAKDESHRDGVTLTEIAREVMRRGLATLETEH